jgi:HPr kinase/phosphorylase
VATASDNAKTSGHLSETNLHASCVAIDGRGLLIVGVSGSGKSGLALDLMALGAVLVSDDRVVLSRVGRDLVASAPPAISGLIEARGIGLLNANPHGPVTLGCVVDLDRTETDRMPAPRQIVLLGASVTLLLKVDSRHFASALMQYCKKGRSSDR